MFLDKEPFLAYINWIQWTGQLENEERIFSSLKEKLPCATSRHRLRNSTRGEQAHILILKPLKWQREVPLN